MDISFSELESMVLTEKLESLFKKAYEQGVEDAKRKFNYPEILTKDHLVEIFQIAKPTVTKLVTQPTFPKLRDVQARYPRDKVFEWINQNTLWVKSNTSYYEAI